MRKMRRKEERREEEDEEDEDKEDEEGGEEEDEEEEDEEEEDEEEEGEKGKVDSCHDACRFRKQRLVRGWIKTTVYYPLPFMGNVWRRHPCRERQYRSVVA